MKKFLCSMIFCLCFFTTLSANDLTTFSQSQKIEYDDLLKKLKSTASDSSNQNLLKNNTVVTLHRIVSVSPDKDSLILEDGSQWTIAWWYRPLKWTVGTEIYIKKEGLWNDITFQNRRTKEVVYGTLESGPYQSKVPLIKSISHSNNTSTVKLDNGISFLINQELSQWAVNHKVTVYQNSQDQFQLWNLDENSFISDCKILDYENPILNLEQQLNKKVIQQKEACNAVAGTLLNYSAGLKPVEKPVGVFLFLGPTGVGKTELAKALTDELYRSRSYLIRFDMSHFTQSHHGERLIGSPPGYVNHEEGGQLTNAIMERPQSIVLLDEMEKAHPVIHKFFLPVFDEGYIMDAKNRKVNCNKVIFIMTSNLCGIEIAKMFNEGMTSDEIAAIIEPILMEHLSPELYNRVEPVIFRPLGKDAMIKLLNLMLSKISARIYLEKGITLNVDSTVKKYLIENGFHPTLGARPLEKLIDKKILTTLAFAVIKNGVTFGNTVTIFYDVSSDEFNVKVE
jgi:hypothetical protein